MINRLLDLCICDPPGPIICDHRGCRCSHCGGLERHGPIGQEPDLDLMEVDFSLHEASRMCCVFQEWMFLLPMQMQSVLLLAARGPDGFPKYHPFKHITWAYRAFVLKGAYEGRALRPGEGTTNTFMSRVRFDDTGAWAQSKKAFIDHLDEAPTHWLWHLAHGMEILGWKYPEPGPRRQWLELYTSICEHYHVNPETEAQLDARLCDWHREHWSK